MLAEIHNKISRTGSNLSDRLEDKLTGDVFGALRYLPFELGLKTVVSGVRFLDSLAQTRFDQLVNSIFGYDYELEFWPNHEEGEIDLLLRLHNSMIGIEVKYFSGLSSEDEVTEEPINVEDSRNQLTRYSRMLTDISGTLPKFLIFLAPYEMMHAIEKSFMDGSKVALDVHIGFLSWQDILESLESMNMVVLDHAQHTITKDIQLLLRKKGLNCRNQEGMHFQSMMLTVSVTLIRRDIKQRRVRECSRLIE